MNRSAVRFIIFMAVMSFTWGAFATDPGVTFRVSGPQKTQTFHLKGLYNEPITRTIKVDSTCSREVEFRSTPCSWDPLQSCSPCMDLGEGGCTVFQRCDGDDCYAYGTRTESYSCKKSETETIGYRQYNVKSTVTVTAAEHWDNKNADEFTLKLSGGITPVFSLTQSSNQYLYDIDFKHTAHRIKAFKDAKEPGEIEVPVSIRIASYDVKPINEGIKAGLKDLSIDEKSISFTVGSEDIYFYLAGTLDLVRSRTGSDKKLYRGSLPYNRYQTILPSGESRIHLPIADLKLKEPIKLGEDYKISLSTSLVSHMKVTEFHNKDGTKTPSNMVLNGQLISGTAEASVKIRAR